MQYDQAIAELESSSQINSWCNGAVDVIPWETSSLANYSSWNPRPIFQSYTVYTRELQNINLEHYQGYSKGTRVVGNSGSIDNRSPLSDEPAIWRYLRENFSVVGEGPLGLCLEKHTPAGASTLEPLTTVSTQIASLDEWVSPSTFDTHPPTYISVSLNQTVLGKLKNLIYKPEIVHVNILFTDGTTARHRLIPSVADEFWSPIVDNQDSLKTWLSGQPLPRAIQSVMVDSEDSVLVSWESTVHFKFGTDNPRTLIGGRLSSYSGATP
jgi:hypothetical protein